MYGNDPVNPAERWATEMAAWEIPEPILAQAPVPPWDFPVALFGADHWQPGTLRARADEALPEGGTVLDVGCGGGAASVPLAARAGLLIGVDTRPDMLASFASAADHAHVDHREVLGEWPAVADDVPDIDVVVCRNVVYNVADIVPFLTWLTRRARRLVVVELTEAHPSVALRSLWRTFWDLDRPAGPDANLLVRVVSDLGYEPVVEAEERPRRKSDVDPDGYVAFVRRRLCLDAERDPEISAALAALTPDGTVTSRSRILSWRPA